MGVAPATAAPRANPTSTAAITLSPATGRAGTTVTVTGTSFGRKLAGTVTAGTATAPFTTSGSGWFQTTVRIPAYSTGTVPVTAATSRDRATASFTVTPAAAPPRLAFGVANPGGPLASAELNEVTALAGEAPSLIMLYKDFQQAPPLAELDAARARGAVPLLTWEPWTWGGGVDQPAYSLDNVTAGTFDAYITSWGNALASWGEPVKLRFAHEKNGNWYPWSEGVNGNEAGDYAAAWRHVHDVVSATGATNVEWVWSPNVPYAGSTPLAGLYPGGAYVDTVALDGYNWGTSQPWSAWTSPQSLFGQGLSELRILAPGKPIIVAETASAEAGGSKATWITDLVAYLNAQPDVIGFVWFHYAKEVDWRINSSRSAADAFTAALAARRT
nr:glycosyl hydrolase [Sinomonas mesophila]